ncbi:MAG: hypothetical protein LBH25_09180 [Fibromonadaceae bacterium]|nr:hypothetical protein [Fibromonadaceae bacterium]
MMAQRVSLIYGSATLEIPANPCPMYAAAERLNYVSVDAAGGEQFVVNCGPTRVNASVSFKCVSYEKMLAYEDFLLNKIKLGLKPFGMACPDYFDLGKGKGEDVENAHYSGPANLSGIIKPSGSNGMFYDLELPYTFVREE